ncbi:MULTISPECIES: Crp/Fnr family transcriptional regulator [unclassified Ruminococcus]|uniref:Crp/Fnr family transcriptional regulator n=1 Tax=unclassified Ruminococcus TaxID=2608920 RepID=UPI00210D4B9C|nr:MULTISPECIES: Crp/Fnr family transcriptional regulator [unclassified Ruminococcus]MCQ4023290.1 cyclic nucleotide-binding domain-containing protein [Ruminococcus sp. zg-924]MCQ4115633.1 cyclic nucleotide-binding domain-containing protein [Ruminococcus sp. zg-921]
MKKYFEILKKIPLFIGIGESDYYNMLAFLNARVENYTKNQFIFREGEPVQHIGIVLTGSVMIIKEDYCGSRCVVAQAESGELFGEAFVCAEVSYLPVSVVSNNNSEIMLVDCKKLFHTSVDSSDFQNTLRNNLLKIIAGKNLKLSQKIEITSKRSTKEKLMAFLLTQAKKSSSAEFTIPYDRQALADYLGVDRSAMCTELGRLRYEGVIEFHKNKFKLKL